VVLVAAGTGDFLDRDQHGDDRSDGDGEPAVMMEPIAVMEPAAMITVNEGDGVRPTEDEPSGKTGGCRSRSDASNVVAHFGRAGQSSGCVDASSVDAGITTD
jgi:hypothetical protein